MEVEIDTHINMGSINHIQNLRELQEKHGKGTTASVNVPMKDAFEGDDKVPEVGIEH